MLGLQGLVPPLVSFCCQSDLFVAFTFLLQLVLYLHVIHSIDAYLSQDVIDMRSIPAVERRLQRLQLYCSTWQSLRSPTLMLLLLPPYPHIEYPSGTKDMLLLSLPIELLTFICYYQFLQLCISTVSSQSPPL